MPKIETIGDLLHWSYANLAMAHYAVEHELDRYDRTAFIIRSRLFAGMRSGSMSPRTLFYDEKDKLDGDRCCAYCGAITSLALDHLVPRKRGGSDGGENLLLACRSCNSSKQARDFLAWAAARQQFPPLLVLRRYLKLAIIFCSENGLLGCPLSEMPPNLPFEIGLVPVNFPPPKDLALYARANILIEAEAAN